MRLIDGAPRIVVRLSREALDWKETRELAKILGVTPGKTRYVLTASPISEKPDQIKIETRSLLGTMFYLSQSLEVPNSHREQGKVTITQYASGEPFEWSQVTGEILRIHSRFRLPGRPYVAVRYRGSWFYIDDSDLNSKSTFSLLAQLFALQAGNSQRPCSSPHIACWVVT